MFLKAVDFFSFLKFRFRKFMRSAFNTDVAEDRGLYEGVAGGKCEDRKRVLQRASMRTRGGCSRGQV